MTKDYGELTNKAKAGRTDGEEVYALARLTHADPAPAMRAAAEVREAAFGPHA